MIAVLLLITIAGLASVLTSCYFLSQNARKVINSIDRLAQSVDNVGGKLDSIQDSLEGVS